MDGGGRGLIKIYDASGVLKNSLFAGNSYFNGGTFGIGDTTADSLLEVSASGGVSDLLMLSSNDANDGDLFIVKNDGKVGIGTTGPNYQLELSQDSAGKPTSNTWTIVSDRRLKKDIKPFTDGLNVITKVNPVSYKLNGKAGTPKDAEGISVIAQDIKEVAPYTISTYKAKFGVRRQRRDRIIRL